MAELTYAPVPRRAAHFIHMISIIGLAISGLYIRFPFFDQGMEFMKWTHYVLMYVVVINLILRIIYGFKSEDKGAIDDLKMGAADFKNTPAVLMYYLHLKDDYPEVAKYASLQKVTYNLFWVLLIVQAITGFALAFRSSLLLAFAPIFGGTALAAAWMRLFHYIGMWVFVIFTTIHAYIAIHEGNPIMMHWVFWRETPGLKEDYEMKLKGSAAH